MLPSRPINFKICFFLRKLNIENGRGSGGSIRESRREEPLWLSGLLALKLWHPDR